MAHFLSSLGFVISVIIPRISLSSELVSHGARALGRRSGRRQCDVRLGVSCVGAARSAQFGCDLLGAVGEVERGESALEHGQRRLGLVEGYFVACLVDAEEADCEIVSFYAVIVVVHQRESLTVAVLSDLTVFGAVDNERLVASGRELFRVGVVDLERNGLATEPVADVIRITVEEGNAKSLVKQVLEILAEVGEDEVAGVLELPVIPCISMRSFPLFTLQLSYQ